MKHKRIDMNDDPDFPKMEAGYTVPEGYFESFGDRLKLRMEAEPKVMPLRGVLFYLKPALGLAAGLAILLTVYLHPYGKQSLLLANLQNSAEVAGDDQSDPLSNTYASLVTDGQFYSALNEMEEYDASKISKTELADYLALNCSDFEIVNANK